VGVNEFPRSGFDEFASMDTSDLDAWRALAERWWTEDIEMIEDPRWPGAGEFHGREQVAGRFQEYFQTLDEGSADLQAVHGDGDVVVLDLVFSARGAGSGARVQQRWAWVVALRDGRVASIRPFLDFDEAFAAAGIDPA
jgi:ketosteroid isomerase-like protein